jgi:hypothetical protein
MEIHMFAHATFANRTIRAVTSLLPLPFLQTGCAVRWEGKADEGDEATNVSTSSEALTNGDVSADPPYVVEISHFGDAGYCTGSVISQHYILTVAHCLGHSGVQPILVWNGANASRIGIRRRPAGPDMKTFAGASRSRQSAVYEKTTRRVVNPRCVCVLRPVGSETRLQFETAML